MPSPTCAYCGGPLPPTATERRRTCSDRCRAALSRGRRGGALDEVAACLDELAEVLDPIEDRAAWFTLRRAEVALARAGWLPRA